MFMIWGIIIHYPTLYFIKKRIVDSIMWVFSGQASSDAHPLLSKSCSSQTTSCVRRLQAGLCAVTSPKQAGLEGALRWWGLYSGAVEVVFLWSAAGLAVSSMCAPWRFGWGARGSMGTGDYICVTLRGGAPWGFTLREGEGDTYRPFLISQVPLLTVCIYVVLYVLVS